MATNSKKDFIDYLLPLTVSDRHFAGNLSEEIRIKRYLANKDSKDIILLWTDNEMSQTWRQLNAGEAVI